MTTNARSPWRNPTKPTKPKASQRQAFTPKPQSGGSWWLGTSREQFNAMLPEQAARMSGVQGVARDAVGDRG